MKRIILKLFSPLLRLVNKIILERHFKNERTTNSLDEKRVLLLAPHVDDETIGAGGTLKKYSDQKSITSVIYLTDGFRSITKDDIQKHIETRKKEAKEAQRLLNIKDIYFFDEKDGELTNSLEIQQRLKEKIELLKPDVIYAPVFVDGHPDHVTTTKILSSTLELMDDKYVEGVVIRLFEINTLLPVDEINFIVDITKYFDTKKEAMKIFKSQVINFGGFIDLAYYKRKLVNDNSVIAVETFLELTPKELSLRLKSIDDPAIFSKYLKQVNKSETLLYATFKNLKWKKTIYRNAKNRRERRDV